MKPPSMADMIGMGDSEPDPMDNAPEEMVESESYIGPEFDLPPGYTPPDDSKDGEDVSVLCKMRIKPDGKACLVSVDGAKFGEKLEQAPKPEMKVESSQSTESAPIGDRLKGIRKKSGLGY